MRYATGAKMLGCTVVGATLLLGGAGALGGLDMAMAQSSLLPVETMQRNAVDYDKVANVSGDFTFCQDVVTPADEVFNLFGTATTALCAKPGYAFDAVTHESYYLNIGGNVEKVYTVGLDEIERMDSKIQKMRCTCGMSPALAMASVKGVKVSDMLSMTDIAPEVCVAMATGNPAKVYTKLNRGVIAPGKEADLLIMDTPMGSVGKDAMEAFAAGDIPGLSYVIIDGKINVKKSSNTPPASRKPC